MSRTLVVSIAAVFLATPTLAFAQAAPPEPPLPPPPPGVQPPPAPPQERPAPPMPGVSTAPLGLPEHPTPSVPPPPSSDSHSLFELSTLRILHERGILSDAEYDSAIHDLSDSAGLHSGDQGTVVMGKWATTVYGFAEADSIYDTTRSFNDSAGAAAVARASTQAGQNGRFTFGVRNSRIGLRLKAPEFAGIKSSGMIEGDFLGNQPGTPDQLFTTPGTAGTYSGTGSTAPVSEGAYFTNPAFRIRHAYVKLETPIIDILMGQTWQLFGWQGAYQINTVEIQGVPGEIYARTPQLRLSHAFSAATR